MPHKHNHGEGSPFQAPLVRGYADSYLKMSRSRAIFLSEDISDQVAADLSSLLLYYDHQDPEAPIHLYIHSNGGAVSGLNGIYDVMQLINAPIKTILLGKCYSAGAVILASGSPGERYALRSSNVMIHGIQFAFPLAGEDLANNKSYLEFIADTNDMLMKILAKHTGQPLEKIRADCKREYWMTAQEALSYNLIDCII
jgi:ATP-dependent Clp protease, protease subunit